MQGNCCVGPGGRELYGHTESCEPLIKICKVFSLQTGELGTAPSYPIPVMGTASTFAITGHYKIWPGMLQSSVRRPRNLLRETVAMWKLENCNLSGFYGILHYVLSKLWQTEVLNPIYMQADGHNCPGVWERHGKVRLHQAAPGNTSHRLMEMTLSCWWTQWPQLNETVLKMGVIWLFFFFQTLHAQDWPVTG